MSADKILIIFTTAPYSTAVGQEGLDVLLMGAAFDLDITVLFMHNGVFQIKEGQDNINTRMKQFTKTFKALEDFGVENVYAFDLSLTATGLSKDQLTVDVAIVDHVFIQTLVRESKRVFTF